MKKVVMAGLIAISTMDMAFAASGITAQSGIVVGGGLGWSVASAPTAATMHAESESNQNQTFQAILGYNHAFTSNWMAGVELSYLYMGKNTYNGKTLFGNGSVSIKNSGQQIMLTSTYLASNGFNGFAKIGTVFESTVGTASVQGFNVIGANGEFEWVPAAAVGVGYMPVQNLNIALQYEHIFGDDWNNTSIDITNPMTQNVMTLGVTYTFPL